VSILVFFFRETVSILVKEAKLEDIVVEIVWSTFQK